MPDVIADASLPTRAVTSLAANALDRSPPAAPPAVAATVLPDSVTIHVIDHGPPPTHEAHVPAAADKAGIPAPTTPIRVAQDLVEAMGGSLDASDTPGGGLTVGLTLPRASVSPTESLPASGPAQAR